MIYSLYSIKELRDDNHAFNRETNLPARPERYHSLWNDIKLAWLVLTRKADAFTWQDLFTK